MHKLAEKIADCMKAKVEAKGIDNIEGQDLVELGMWTDIIKDLVCYDKDKKIIEAMDEAEESEEAMKYIEMYEDYPDMRKGYRGQPRDSRGRYMSRRGGRRGYEEPMYHMPLDVYKDYSAEELRDMDRNIGRMYYTDNANGGSMATRMQGGMNGGRDNREGRSGMSRRGYMEAKEMGKEKGEKMKELEKYMKELSEDVTEMIGDASPEEKAMLKSKMQTLLQKIQ
jgi:hypothetical protein